ncbi:hypothetical protein [Leeuwenhoekiella marinoflava]|uniref:Uncharacterized protein n=2 Tax=Leeuwenhoekiella marinoflava TaxID=988 RepID=A0A4Q0PQV6_9FLAO|nr:hypothetical protein [Leeuwenhoekiella marinoflava]RXG33009.1 hypothetical protein DSL99_102 [Leeuwenhoekiella marinoflava]SHE35330.1 hypothetical protein SAMN02745246_00162 [Leeuwenhoekiella marinoflava DSM 3653]
MLQETLNRYLDNLSLLLSDIPSSIDSINKFLYENFNVQQSSKGVDEAMIRKHLEIRSDLGLKVEYPSNSFEYEGEISDLILKLRVKIQSVQLKYAGILQQIEDLKDFDYLIAEKGLHKAKGKIKLKALEYNSLAFIDAFSNKEFYKESFNLFKDCISDFNILTNKRLKFFNDHYQALRYELAKAVPYSPFGDNLFYVKSLYQWLNEYLFDENINEFDFLLIFNPNYKGSFRKVNLNGYNLADYAYLIRELQNYFIPEIKAVTKTYYTWWSDRVTYNGSEKSLDDVSRLVSKINSGENRLKLQAEIDGLITLFKTTP